MESIGKTTKHVLEELRVLCSFIYMCVLWPVAGDGSLVNDHMYIHGFILLLVEWRAICCYC